MSKPAKTASNGFPVQTDIGFAPTYAAVALTADPSMSRAAEPSAAECPPLIRFARSPERPHC